MSQRFQFLANFPVVVDFAVEGNRRVPIVADDGLVSAFQVDDLEADRDRVAWLPSKTPCWSGPRWNIASVMRWAILLLPVPPRRVNPAIPHIYGRIPVPR